MVPRGESEPKRRRVLCMSCNFKRLIIPVGFHEEYLYVCMKCIAALLAHGHDDTTYKGRTTYRVESRLVIDVHRDRLPVKRV